MRSSPGAAWDAHQNKIRGWWVVCPATFGVGICFGAPLYLLMREYKLGDAAFCLESRVVRALGGRGQSFVVIARTTRRP